MMRRGDVSLVFFTVLSQWSVGIVICLFLLNVSGGAPSSAINTGPSPANPLRLALLLIVAATTASFLHLGNPLNAPKAVRNLATSWLSREILAIGLYSAGLAAALLYGWRTGALYPAYLLALCAVTGLLLIWTMSRVYRIPTIPAWNSGHTPLGFILTTLSLGSITSLLFAGSGALGAGSGGFSLLAGMLAGSLALELAAAILLRRRLLEMNTGFNGPEFDGGAWRTLFLVRMVLLIAALLAALPLLASPGSVANAWLYAAMGLVFAQETAGRVMFYASYFRVGV
jgi:anaerobic dimethyl sulfoxide reductase subunit C (anchor subunit)